MAMTDEERKELLRGLNGIKKEVEAVNRLQKKAYETGKSLKTSRPYLPPVPEYSLGQQVYFACVLGSMITGVLVSILSFFLLQSMGLLGMLAGFLSLVTFGSMILIIYALRKRETSKLRKALEIIMLVFVGFAGVAASRIYGIAVFSAAFLFIKVKIKRSQERTQRVNEEIAQRNSEIERYNDGIHNELYEIQAQAEQHVSRARDIGGTWFPVDYYFMDAVESFITVISNQRANSIQEMVNLYEDKRHKERVEERLKQISDITEQSVREQQILSMQMTFSNILQLGQLWSMDDLGRKLDNIYYRY